MSSPHNTYSQAAKKTPAGGVKTLVREYDETISLIENGHSDEAANRVARMRRRLVFGQAPEFAVGLYSLYEYVEEKLWSGCSEEALSILLGLRSAWYQALNSQRNLSW